MLGELLITEVFPTYLLPGGIRKGPSLYPLLLPGGTPPATTCKVVFNYPSCKSLYLRTTPSIAISFTSASDVVVYIRSGIMHAYGRARAPLMRMSRATGRAGPSPVVPAANQMCNSMRSPSGPSATLHISV